MRPPSDSYLNAGDAWACLGEAYQFLNKGDFRQAIEYFDRAEKSYDHLNKTIGGFENERAMALRQKETALALVDMSMSMSLEFLRRWPDHKRWDQSTEWVLHFLHHYETLKKYAHQEATQEEFNEFVAVLRPHSDDESFLAALGADAERIRKLIK
ncbi:MAG: hypothetical protein AB1631_14245 [Acidobacteriota bacterium]